jgi:hypothetical protein
MLWFLTPYWPQNTNFFTPPFLASIQFQLQINGAFQKGCWRERKRGIISIYSFYFLNQLFINKHCKIVLIFKVREQNISVDGERVMLSVHPRLLASDINTWPQQWIFHYFRKERTEQKVKKLWNTEFKLIENYKFVEKFIIIFQKCVPRCILDSNSRSMKMSITNDDMYTIILLYWHADRRVLYRTVDDLKVIL